MVRQPDATMQPAPQNDQLMSKHRVLSLKPQLRLGWRGQDGQNVTEQPNHSASLGDSITSSTRIRFSVRTACCMAADSPPIKAPDIPRTASKVSQSHSWTLIHILWSSSSSNWPARVAAVRRQQSRFCAEGMRRASRRSSAFNNAEHLFGFTDKGVHGLVDMRRRVRAMVLQDGCKPLLLR